jgi:hypothetical protein
MTAYDQSMLQYFLASASVIHKEISYFVCLLAFVTFDKISPLVQAHDEDDDDIDGNKQQTPSVHRKLNTAL